MPLTRLIYTSRAAQRTSDADVKAIVDKARTNNARNNVTGMLVYARGSFLQVLEGDPDVLDATFKRIRADPRHLCVERLVCTPARRRLFKGWRMGLVKLDKPHTFHGKPLESLHHLARTLAELDTEKAVPEILREFVHQAELRQAA